MSRAVVLLTLVGCATAGESTSIDAQVEVMTSDAAMGPQRPDAAVTPSNPCAFTGALATYTFAGAAGNQVETEASSKASGVNAAPIKRAATLTATSGAASINSTNWPTATQVDPTKFYTLTITPPSGCMMSVTSIALDVKSSGTGPAAGALATSSDNFATFKSVSTGTPSTPALTVTTTAPLEVRVYGYGASSTSGTMRVQGTLTINGSMQ